MTNTELIAEARRYAPTFTDDERGYDSELVGRLAVALAQSERDLAEAWDEGHSQALANVAWPLERKGNPYRIEQTP